MGYVLIGFSDCIHPLPSKIVEFFQYQDFSVLIPVMSRIQSQCCRTQTTFAGETEAEDSAKKLGAEANPEPSGGCQGALGIFRSIWGMPWIEKCRCAMA